MRVLVVGSGGREHALVWALQRSAVVTEVVAAPGNAGIARVAECHPVDANDPGRGARARSAGSASTSSCPPPTASS